MTSERLSSSTAKVWTCWSQKCIHPKPCLDSLHSAEPQKTWNESNAAQSLSEDCLVQSSPHCRFLSCQLPPCRSRRGLRRRQRSDFRIEFIKEERGNKAATWQPRGTGHRQDLRQKFCCQSLQVRWWASVRESSHTRATWNQHTSPVLVKNICDDQWLQCPLCHSNLLDLDVLGLRATKKWSK
jgi:hypothetical protein